MGPGHPILQFGTGRFLQAHVDLFVSEALDRGEALGGITVVQSTADARSSRRTAALAAGEGFDVRVRGLVDGRPVDETRRCRSVRAALQAAQHWTLVRQDVASGAVRLVVSNTGDAGWDPVPSDTREALRPSAPAPGAYPAKLLVLLHDRWQAGCDEPLSVLPCELVSRNGEVLREAVLETARRWRVPDGFLDHLDARVRWASTLVDRIVSEALEPVGAVTEPYALWAVERQKGLALPCRHPAIVSTDDLARHERLKLHLLNLGHTLLAEDWLRGGHPEGMTVLQAMHHPALRAGLEAAWHDEVLPVFALWNQADEAMRYLAVLRDRLLNPFLAHRLSDIAQNHAVKKRRRLAPVVAAARTGLPALRQPRLQAALADEATASHDVAVGSS